KTLSRWKPWEDIVIAEFVYILKEKGISLDIQIPLWHENNSSPCLSDLMINEDKYSISGIINNIKREKESEKEKEIKKIIEEKLWRKKDVIIGGKKIDREKWERLIADISN